MKETGPKAKVTREVKTYKVEAVANVYTGQSVEHTFEGTEVKVVSDEHVIWKKDVLTKFGHLAIPVTKPFYAKRVKWATEKANKKAEDYNA